MAGCTTSGGAPRSAGRGGAPWAVLAAGFLALAVLGVVGTAWLIVSLPTHEDGAHGGDGATALAVLVLGGAWIALCGTVAVILGIVALVRRH